MRIAEGEFASVAIFQWSSSELTPFITSFNFIIDMIIVPSSVENNGTDSCSNSGLIDLECRDAVRLLSEEPSKLQVYLDHLNDKAAVIGMRFPSSKCKKGYCRAGVVNNQTLFLLRMS